MSVVKLQDSNFQQFLSEHPKVIVKFYADWCGTCRLFHPKYVALSNKEEYKGVLFGDMNAEENPETRKLVGVKNLPFFATFENGALVSADFTAKAEGVESMIHQIVNG